MVLPLTRNTTYAPKSPVLSTDLNAIQDEIIALQPLRHAFRAAFDLTVGALAGGVHPLALIFPETEIGTSAWVVNAAREIQVPAAGWYDVKYQAPLTSSAGSELGFRFLRGANVEVHARFAVTACSWIAASALVQVTNPASERFTFDLSPTGGGVPSFASTAGDYSRGVFIRRVG
jgi:hypothetical protein